MTADPKPRGTAPFKFVDPGFPCWSPKRMRIGVGPTIARMILVVIVLAPVLALTNVPFNPLEMTRMSTLQARPSEAHLLGNRHLMAAIFL